VSDPPRKPTGNPSGEPSGNYEPGWNALPIRNPYIHTAVPAIVRPAAAPHPCTLGFQPQPFEPHRVASSPTWPLPDKPSRSQADLCTIRTVICSPPTNEIDFAPRRLAIPSRRTRLAARSSRNDTGNCGACAAKPELLHTLDDGIVVHARCRQMERLSHRSAWEMAWYPGEAFR